MPMAMSRAHWQREAWWRFEFQKWGPQSCDFTGKVWESDDKRLEFWDTWDTHFKACGGDECQHVLCTGRNAAKTTKHSTIAASSHAKITGHIATVTVDRRGCGQRCFHRPGGRSASWALCGQ